MDDYSKEVIRVEKFKGERDEDFEIWTMRLMATLEGRDLAGVVNGEEFAPEDVSSRRSSNWLIVYCRSINFVN